MGGELTYHRDTRLGSLRSKSPNSFCEKCDRRLRYSTESLLTLCNLIRPSISFRTSDCVPTFLRQILLLCIVLHSICIPTSANKVHKVSWSMNHNSLHAPVNDTYLYVKEDDILKFECDSSDGKLALFFTEDRKDYEVCLGGNFLFSCNTTMAFEVQVLQFQWLAYMPTFNKGKPVYFYGRPFQCLYNGMRLITVLSEKPKPKTDPIPKTDPLPKKTTVSDWGNPKTTVFAGGTRTKAEYLTLTQRPKTSANIQPMKPSTTKLPKPTVKKSVPMLKTSRASHAFLGQSPVYHSVTVLLAVMLSLLHQLQR